VSQAAEALPDYEPEREAMFARLEQLASCEPSCLSDHELDELKGLSSVARYASDLTAQEHKQLGEIRVAAFREQRRRAEANEHWESSRPPVAPVLVVRPRSLFVVPPTRSRESRARRRPTANALSGGDDPPDESDPPDVDQPGAAGRLGVEAGP
jgi:hypothetical protein